MHKNLEKTTTDQLLNSSSAPLVAISDVFLGLCICSYGLHCAISCSRDAAVMLPEKEFNL